MAAGLPVVATPNVGARLRDRRGPVGELVELPELGGALVDLLGDADRRERLAERGRRRAELFELGRVVSAYEQVYRSAGRGRA